MDTGASIAPYNHFELGQPIAHRVRLGTSDRGEHDQPMKITGTAIKLGAFALVLLLFTAIIIVVFGQMRFDRTTGYSAIFQQRQRSARRPVRPRLGRRGRQGLQGRAASTAATRCEVDFNVDRVAAAVPGHHGLDPLPEPDRRPVPGTQARRQRQAAARRRHHPDRAHRARARPRRVDRRLPPAVPGARPRQGQQHRPVDHHDLPGPGRHHQRHPRPDGVADVGAGRPGPGHRRGDQAT